MIEIIPKPAQKLPLWENILFYLSLALLLASILSFFVLDNFQKKNLDTLENLKQILEKEKTPEEKALEKKILTSQKKIKDFAMLFEGRQLISNFFPILENLTHPKVWFSNFQLNPGESKVAVSGEAESFQALSQQLFIFQNDKNISNVKLLKVSIGKKGKIQFAFDFIFNLALFK